jgi:hypothetical protein
MGLFASAQYEYFDHYYQSRFILQTHRDLLVVVCHPGTTSSKEQTW